MGAERIYEPGEPERVTRAEREAEGIPVDAATWAQICSALAVGMSAEQISHWSAFLE